MNYPERIDSSWISTLSDEELQRAERELKKNFAAEEKAERKLRGKAYDLMRGPASLTLAWMRWSMVNTAARSRGVRVHYRS